jgi:hypothetical protein
MYIAGLAEQFPISSMTFPLFDVSEGPVVVELVRWPVRGFPAYQRQMDHDSMSSEAATSLEIMVSKGNDPLL